MRKSRTSITRLIPSIAIAACLPSVHAAEPGFLEGSSVRNDYFSRDFSDIVGASRKSKAEEWAQGFIFNYRSGYTPGAVGFGLDALGVVGVKLDSSPERTGTGLQPELPVLMFSDIRLPPPYQDASLVSNEIPGLILQAGQLRSFSRRDSTDSQHSWQVRDDLDFVSLGLSGLNATLRYVRGSDVRTGRGFEGEDSERDIDLSYTVRNGPLKDVSLRLRHAVAHANYRTDIDENRVVVSYTMKLI